MNLLDRSEAKEAEQLERYFINRAIFNEGSLPETVSKWARKREAILSNPYWDSVRPTGLPRETYSWKDEEESGDGAGGQEGQQMLAADEADDTTNDEFTNRNFISQIEYNFTVQRSHEMQRRKRSMGGIIGRLF